MEKQAGSIFSWHETGHACRIIERKGGRKVADKQQLQEGRWPGASGRGGSGFCIRQQGGCVVVEAAKEAAAGLVRSSRGSRVRSSRGSSLVSLTCKPSSTHSGAKMTSVSLPPRRSSWERDMPASRGFMLLVM